MLSRRSCSYHVATYSALGVDVADISGNAGGTANVEEGEVGDTRVELEEERQRLADSAAGTEDSNLGELHGSIDVSGCARSSSMAGQSPFDLIVLFCWELSSLTLLAEAEKARRWTAPTTDCET